MVISFTILYLFIAILSAIDSEGTGTGSRIVIVRSRDTLIVAADSRLTFRKDFALFDSPLVQDSFCKIRRFDRTFVAAAGLYARKEFDVFQIAARACQTQGTVYQKAQAFESLVQDPLVSAWRDIRQNNLFGRSPALQSSQIAFFAAYDEVPVLVLITVHPVMHQGQFSFLDSYTTRITRILVPRGGANDSLYGIVMGYEDPHFFKPVSEQALLDQAVQILAEEVRTHDDSGGPVDVVAITKHSESWLNKKPNCAE